MSSLSFNGSSDYCRLAATLGITAVPFSVSGWMEFTAVSVANRLYSFCNSGQASTHYFSGGSQVANTFVVIANDGTSRSAGDSGSAITTNVWYHYCCRNVSTTSRLIYRNGANSASSVTSCTPSGIDRFSIGVNDTSTPTGFMNGHLTGLTIWNADIGADVIPALALGRNPRSVMPHKIVFYSPYLEIGSTVLDWCGNPITRTGTSVSTSTPTLMGHG